MIWCTGIPLPLRRLPRCQATLPAPTITTMG